MLTFQDAEVISQIQYYECHITIDPVNPKDEVKQAHLREVAGRYGFRVATLLVQNGRAPNPDDAVMTGKNPTLQGMKRFMDLQHNELEAEGFSVRRKKIEAVIFDEEL